MTIVIIFDNFEVPLILVKKYITQEGDDPFNNWFERLDNKAKLAIDVYIVRVASGASKKNIKAIASGLYEIKINHGPGYRVYFAVKQNQYLLLLLGGDKSTQKRDIVKAKLYWRLYNEKS